MAYYSPAKIDALYGRLADCRSDDPQDPRLDEISIALSRKQYLSAGNMLNVIEEGG